MLSVTPPLTSRERSLVILVFLALFGAVVFLKLWTNRQLDRSAQDWQEQSMQRGQR